MERYGPHLKYEPPGGWQSEAQNPAEKLVQTHCCFCGQQCEIQLKVRNNEVIGFEPWEEFPFNRGMLCPKGVKRYMQSSHPDRLLLPLMRDDSGFRPASWNDALALTARRLRDIQERYGRDAVAVYGGASLTTEKAYLLGKFARVALGTRHIDYNGRLCMVSAGVAYKLAFGVDRSPNPLERFSCGRRDLQYAHFAPHHATRHSWRPSGQRPKNLQDTNRPKTKRRNRTRLLQSP